MGKTSGSADVHFKEAHLKRRKCPRFAADCIVSIGAWQDVITGLLKRFQRSVPQFGVVTINEKKKKKNLVDKLKGTYI